MQRVRETFVNKKDNEYVCLIESTIKRRIHDMFSSRGSFTLMTSRSPSTRFP